MSIRALLLAGVALSVAVVELVFLLRGDPPPQAAIRSAHAAPEAPAATTVAMPPDDAGRPAARAPRRRFEPPPRPDELTRADVLSAMDATEARAEGCPHPRGQTALVPVKVTVASSGRVSSAHVDGPLADAPFARCVEAAAKSAVFRPFQRNQVIVTWPYVLR